LHKEEVFGKDDELLLSRQLWSLWIISSPYHLFIHHTNIYVLSYPKRPPGQPAPCW
jgi:hypothetical protein